MVSFQCNACGDVVKKPKLDQHRYKCQAGFDCIDCSKTFGTPAEYKGHTACISEAEKYQKGLYKGPKTGEGTTPKNNYPSTLQSTEYPGSNTNRAYHNPRRGREYGRQGASRWGIDGISARSRYNPTGPNGMPLGTPTRGSPSTSPAKVDGVEASMEDTIEKNAGVVEQVVMSTDDKGVKEKRVRKRKSLSLYETTEEPKTKKSKIDDGVRSEDVNAEKKKDKKSKKDTKVKERERGEDVTEALPASDKKGSKEKGTKKKRKEKEDADGLDQDEPSNTMSTPDVNDLTADEEKKAKKRRRKEETEKERLATEVVNDLGGSLKKKKEKKKDRNEDVMGTCPDLNGGDADEEKKARKRRRREEKERLGVEVGAVGEARKEQKEEKEREKKERKKKKGKAAVGS